MGARGGYRQTAPMPRVSRVKKDDGPSLGELREAQRKLLENLPAWLRYRGLRQKDVANTLGTSEGQISKYLGGKIQMTVGLLRQIAAVLKAHPGDLLKPPPSDGLGIQVEEALAIMGDLTPAEWDTVMNTARAIRAAKKAG